MENQPKINSAINLDSDSAEQDAWLETLLQEDASESHYLDDNGFSTRVMSSLPRSRASKDYRWILWIAASLGILIGGFWLSGFELYFQALSSSFEGNATSLNCLIILLSPIALLYWFAATLFKCPNCDLI
ncbi:DUF5056 domain-containing protein [Solimicrobium silvestre]|uniref:Uncharacterized protein n=1 Tax=Solimicrobium silvestre TaxID=2099400 RepID=A0A2S9GXB4_9BURK|nr:DUF5056 domain-containing protein [Solimicrobium silvestre]PRC92364.1 hypothetical protein S2091_3023 [Solimicrobium silvestre]